MLWQFIPGVNKALRSWKGGHIFEGGQTYMISTGQLAVDPKGCTHLEPTKSLHTRLPGILAKCHRASLGLVHAFPPSACGEYLACQHAHHYPNRKLATSVWVLLL